MIQDELVKIWEETRQTVFMITHDVDEAILLSDRIFLMSNGPNARIAESVKVDIPTRGPGPPSSRIRLITKPGTTWWTSWSTAVALPCLRKMAARNW